jgi:hypothetical protein
MVDCAMTTGDAHPLRPRGARARAQGLQVLGLAALLLARAGWAAAFPLLDVTNEDQVPPGIELAEPAVQDLQHQLQLVNGLGAPAGGGWTFLPRINWQEELTDNVLQLNSPRRADLVTFISPGIGIAGDLPRVRLTFDFAPTLALYARTGDLNALTEQMNGLGSITLVPDLAYVDVRALSGVQSEFGGLGGLGTIGAAAGAGLTPQTAIPTLAGNSLGLNKDNEIQTTSFGISPYLLRRFGDWGTGKLGYSLNVAESNSLSGFAAPPFPTGAGANSQTLVTNEEIAHFGTGDFLQFFQDNFDVDLVQSQTTTGAGVVNGQTGLPYTTTQSGSSTEAFVSDQITYKVNRSIALFASGGHEDIVYTGINAQSIHDLTWSFGTTLTPNPDSLLTVSYGHLDGFNSLTANGHYAVTARTLLTASYGSTLGTQLQQLQNQLNLATANGVGGLVNAQTGGQLFGATNALAVQEGVFRTTTLAVGSQTTLNRDIISINLLMAKQSSSGGTNPSSAETKTASVSWLHQMRPDVTVSAAISYSIQDQSSGFVSAANPGNNTSVVGTLAWQWQISDTLSANMRYSFLERSSAVTAYDVYQNILILGISKHF